MDQAAVSKGGPALASTVTKQSFAAASITAAAITETAVDSESVISVDFIGITTAGAGTRIGITVEAVTNARSPLWSIGLSGRCYSNYNCLSSAMSHL